jgi:hypothetical protein
MLVSEARLRARSKIVAFSEGVAPKVAEDEVQQRPDGESTAALVPLAAVYPLIAPSLRPDLSISMSYSHDSSNGGDILTESGGHA